MMNKKYDFEFEDVFSPDDIALIEENESIASTPTIPSQVISSLSRNQNNNSQSLKRKQYINNIFDKDPFADDFPSQEEIDQSLANQNELFTNNTKGLNETKDFRQQLLEDLDEQECSYFSKRSIQSSKSTGSNYSSNTPLSSIKRTSLPSTSSTTPKRIITPSFSRNDLSDENISDFSTPSHQKNKDYNSHKKKKIPGPAGLLNKSVGRKSALKSTKNHNGSQTSQPPLTASLEPSQNPENDFQTGPWRQMVDELQFDENDPKCPLNKFNILYILQRVRLKGPGAIKKVPFLAILIKNLDVTFTDGSAVFKDKSGEMKASLSNQVLNEYSDILHSGCVLLLKDVSIISPLRCWSTVKKDHHLNVTLNSLLSIYSIRENNTVKITSVAGFDVNELISQSSENSFNVSEIIIDEKEKKNVLYKSFNDTNMPNQQTNRLHIYNSPKVNSSFKSVITDKSNINKYTPESSLYRENRSNNSVKNTDLIRSDNNTSVSNFNFNPVVKNTQLIQSLSNSLVKSDKYIHTKAREIEDTLEGVDIESWIEDF